MSRPQKEGLDYFPHDCDLSRSERRIGFLRGRRIKWQDHKQLVGISQH